MIKDLTTYEYNNELKKQMGIVYSLYDSNKEMCLEALKDALDIWTCSIVDLKLDRDNLLKRISEFSKIDKSDQKEILFIYDSCFDDLDNSLDKFNKLVNKYRIDSLYSKNEYTNKTINSPTIASRDSTRIRKIKDGKIKGAEELNNYINNDDLENIVSASSSREDDEYIADMSEISKLLISATAPSQIKTSFENLDKKYGKIKTNEEDEETIKQESFEIPTVSEAEIKKDRLLAILGVDLAHNEKFYKKSDRARKNDAEGLLKILRFIGIFLLIICGIYTLVLCINNLFIKAPDFNIFTDGIAVAVKGVLSGALSIVKMLINAILKLLGNVLKVWQLDYIIIINLLTRGYIRVKDNIDRYNSYFTFISPLPVSGLKVLVCLGGIIGLDKEYCEYRNHSFFKEEQEDLKTVPSLRLAGLVVDVLVLLTIFL